MILGDNGNIFRWSIVGTDRRFLTFNYDNDYGAADRRARGAAARLHAGRAGLQRGRGGAATSAPPTRSTASPATTSSTARSATTSCSAKARTTTSSAATATTGSPAAPATTASSATTAASSPAATARRSASRSTASPRSRRAQINAIDPEFERQRSSRSPTSTARSSTPST